MLLKPVDSGYQKFKFRTRHKYALSFLLIGIVVGLFMGYMVWGDNAATEAVLVSDDE